MYVLDELFVKFSELEKWWAQSEHDIFRYKSVAVRGRNSENYSRVQTDIRRGHFPSTGLNHYRPSQLAR